MSSNFCVAVHGLVYLYHCRATISSEELAKHICTNPARVRKVMLMLKKQGLVLTREGKDGGYSCGPEAGGITLKHIAEATKMHFAEGFRTGKGCPGMEGSAASADMKELDMDCLNASGMAQVMQELYEQMDALCMERLSRTTVADLEKRLKTKGDLKG
ncbi:MAG TPA: Rrf2 family transcriptional regulator [Candidatus Eisenbergiella merdipullorum]|uniref:Rrf2 family transcriptional regulator n=1 Tax=Candidatus Eisenbergiella merdipullorum TaxID=2838553 RepID=A0A9D2I6C9_9FIRM|nr:Rrf2 family transcriptional regulator [Candidatus Eisenbergiella merdipullorum]